VRPGSPRSPPSSRTSRRRCGGSVQLGQELRRPEDPEAVPGEMPEVLHVLGDDDPGPGGERDGGDVPVVDPATDDTLRRRQQEEVSPAIGRQIVDLEPRQDLGLEEAPGVIRFEAKLLGEARRDGEELQAAVPRGPGARELVRGQGVQDPVGVTAPRLELDDPAEQDGRVEERPALRGPTVSLLLDDRGEVHGRPLRCGDPGSCDPASPDPDQTWPGDVPHDADLPVFETDLELRTRLESRPRPDRRGDHHSTCLVDGRLHAMMLPQIWQT
jgi:hypothetical protein